MKETESAVFPILPLRDMVVFPHSVSPVFVARPRSLNAVEQAMKNNKKILLISQNYSDIENPHPDDLYTVGTVGDILQIFRTSDGKAKILIEGLFVVHVVNFINSGSFLQGVVVRQKIIYNPSKRMEALKRATLKQFETYVSLSDRIPDDLYYSIQAIQNPENLVNSISNYINLKVKEKQAILDENDVEKKYVELARLLSGENDLLKLENDILTQVKSRIGKNQKEFYLNEQLKIIESELGLSGEEDLELNELEEQVFSSKMSEEASEKAEKELGRLSKMAPISPEATVSRTYIEWLVSMPWGVKTRDKLDLDRAQKILDKEHYGLKKVKERILEYLAVHKLVKNPKGPVLCFIGPPGVGKTTLARSIAKAMGRKFVRISLGGIRDEAEIRGHRRTYIGALPGKIIKSIKKAESMNPVFLLDEIDKMAYDLRGDPSSALLEVLDPEQNTAFNDHYLDVDFDLSSVMFITTANVEEEIPHTLMDRMEVINLPGYTHEEKVEIAGTFLVPKQIKAHGLTKRNLVIPKEIISMVISDYTREAGVRNLEREIAKICRKVARDMVGKNKRWKEVITAGRIKTFFGPQRFSSMVPHKEGEIGVATGLAWTEMGGEILPTETSVVKGKGSLILTGQLGDVMQESAKAALTYIRARCSKFKIKSNFYNDVDIHIHIPEGAIPKDGPSAGVTLVTAMLSALSKRPVRQDLAMTGEITLRGKVLKIGGLKEKILAAHRAHIKTIILPQENKDDLEDIPNTVRKDMDFILVKNLDEVLKAALMKKKGTLHGN
jgi:ATP-dependent Lon protease